MKVLGIRFCQVSAEGRAQAEFLRKLGLAERAMERPEGVPPESFMGAIFPAGESWVEIWEEGEGMAAGTMLQVVVDDADAFAAHARQQGLSPQGPMDLHGERIYFASAPGGLQISFQSKLPEGE
ncbi:hypothetical protein DL240_02560 [Lujinxingia litoralis]|uniref:VOC domain-containing protein n=1 Tax=Lujinxingia litoralis TaxID=2211119 RepID=A0A328C9H1_9DELT|nr:hypothetical protein [Lujinxingia litoralis]RAL25115.1 hypothetical protein DL240_02560 [Lujinxingia litoralis]